MSIAPFLTKERFSNWLSTIINSNNAILNFLLLNSPLLYTIYNNTFSINIFLFAYIYCGFFQGIINNYLYTLCDVYFHGKPIDIKEWKATRFYDLVIFNTDSVYLHVLGATIYTALTVVPDSIKWSFTPFGYMDILQLCIVAVLHDVFFTLIHYIVHKIPFLRTLHLTYHHDCPFDIGSSRCTLAADGSEAIVRDLYSLVIPTYIVGYCGMPFNAYLWVPYYTLYSLWALYIHTGVNKYHRLHHTQNSSRNYGIYYITDYFMGTLDLTH
jgi:sterol desaturase/sphingolipid hydroxylase (fatty acid hydroxylase superfamily)